MRCLPILLIGLAGVATAAAPVSEPADQQRWERLERRVNKITELTLQLDSLRLENQQLRGDIETLHHNLEQLKRQQRDHYLDIDQRLAAITAAADPAPPAVQQQPTIAPQIVPAVEAQTPTAPEQPDPPAVVVARDIDMQSVQTDYDAAYILLSPTKRQYQEAIQAFEVFLQKYPTSTLAGNAQYWLGEAHYVSHDNAAALQAFEKVIIDYPQSPKVPGALYKIGRIHQVQNDLNAAQAALQRVVQDYPNSSAASLARERLMELGR